jgi:hypothetical protein
MKREGMASSQQLSLSIRHDGANSNGHLLEGSKHLAGTKWPNLSQSHAPD